MVARAERVAHDTGAVCVREALEEDVVPVENQVGPGIVLGGPKKACCVELLADPPAVHVATHHDARIEGCIGEDLPHLVAARARPDLELRPEMNAVVPQRDAVYHDRLGRRDTLRGLYTGKVRKTV